MWFRNRPTVDAQDVFDRLDSELRRVNRQLRETQAELHGVRTGQNLVAAQLAKDLQLGTLREQQHQQSAARSYQDKERALRIVAGHVLDMRGSAHDPEVVQECLLLVDAFADAGMPLRPALMAIEIERAESWARITATAAEATAAVADAPRPVAEAAEH